MKMNINFTKSVDIYDTLMNGRMINRQQLNNAGEWIADPWFDELMNNLQDYRMMFQAFGFRLVENPNYVYLIDQSLTDGKTDISMKAYCLLLIIGKYLTVNGFALSKITSPTGGLTEADFIKMGELPYVAEILEKAKLGNRHKDDLFSVIKSVLVERKLMLEKPSSQSYILSNAGKAFFDELMLNKDKIIDSENDEKFILNHDISVS